jgi:hypothetical protein
MRGRPKETDTSIPTERKFTRVYEHEDSTVIWKFDLDKFERGPIEVEIKYKNGMDKPKYWNKLAKQAKDDRRQARQMKKINENNNTKKPRKNAKKN